jgi:hypothetical protein
MLLDSTINFISCSDICVSRDVGYESCPFATVRESKYSWTKL